jgi:hypothetical protein
LNKYRRIEVNAYRRRVTVLSGEWRPDELVNEESDRADDGVSLDDTNACEPVEPDSTEGQLILVEAVRTLQQRLTPEARATICHPQKSLAWNSSNPDAFYLKLRAIYQLICARALRFARKEK